MRKVKKTLIYLVFIMVVSFFMTNNALAKPNEIHVGKDNLFIENGTKENKEKTAIYNSDSKVLTLNNYNGEKINIEVPFEVTIKLVGENKITTPEKDYKSYGISSNKDLYITGDGSLSVVKFKSGIYIPDGDLTINNATLNMSDFSNNAIEVDNGNLAINNANINIASTNENGIYVENNNSITNSDVTIKDTYYNGIYVNSGNFSSTNSNIDIEDSEEEGIYVSEGNFNAMDSDLVLKRIGSTAITAFGTNNNIDSNITIDEASEGIYFTGIGEGKVTINGGNININADYEGILAANLTINDGDINVNVNNTSDIPYGIISSGDLRINGGRVKIKTPENGVAIASISIEGNEGELSLSDNMIVIPDKYTLQNVNVNLEDPIGLSFEATTFGLDGASLTFSEDNGFVFANIANEILIEEYKEVNPKTFDSLSIYITLIIISSISLLSLIIFFKKRITNKNY